MPDRVILDSSIIAAIFLQDDDDSLRARKMIRNYDRITLDTAIADIGNVAWKKTVLFGEDSSEMLSGLEDGIKFINGMCDMLKASDLAEEAYEIAMEEQDSLLRFPISGCCREGAGAALDPGQKALRQGKGEQRRSIDVIPLICN